MPSLDFYVTWEFPGIPSSGTRSSIETLVLSAFTVTLSDRLSEPEISASFLAWMINYEDGTDDSIEWVYVSSSGAIRAYPN